MTAEEETHAHEIGKRLIEARRELGMSQRELADLIHVSERSMQAYESGDVIPYRKLKDLGDVLSRPMSWILHGDKAEVSSMELVPLVKSIVERLDRLVALAEQQAA